MVGRPRSGSCARAPPPPRLSTPPHTSPTVTARKTLTGHRGRCRTQRRRGRCAPRLDTIANTIVHVFMYYFYACQTVGINVWWKKYLTSLQIFQFIADETGNVFWSYYAAYLGRTCSGSWFGFWFGMLVIASFLGLFIQFYQSSYSKPKGGSAKASKDD